MENFLVRPLMIADHPVATLETGAKLCYMRALGEFLCYLTRDDKKARLAFEAWSHSILGQVPAGAWSFTQELDNIDDGLTPYGGKDAGTIRKSFLFDCFYLLEKSSNDLLLNAYILLKGKTKGQFDITALNHAHDYFKGASTGGHLPETLRRHRRHADRFTSRPLRRVLVAATMSAGKSTLVNALVGHRINRIQSTACTSRAHYIYNKQAEEGAVAHFGPNRLAYTEDYSLLLSEEMHGIGIRFRSPLARERICLIDTPGVNFSGDTTHGAITRNLIESNAYDLLILVLNGTQLAINDEEDLMQHIGKNCRKKVIVALNQCDLFKPRQDSVKEAIRTTEGQLMKAGIRNAIIVPVSAHAAYLSRLRENPDYEFDEEDEYELEKMEKRMAKPYYRLPSYLPGVPDDVVLPSLIDRSAIPYLEHLIISLQ